MEFRHAGRAARVAHPPQKLGCCSRWQYLRGTRQHRLRQNEAQGAAHQALLATRCCSSQPWRQNLGSHPPRVSSVSRAYTASLNSPQREALRHSASADASRSASAGWRARTVVCCWVRIMNEACQGLWHTCSRHNAATARGAVDVMTMHKPSRRKLPAPRACAHQRLPPPPRSPRCSSPGCSSCRWRERGTCTCRRA